MKHLGRAGVLSLLCSTALITPLFSAEVTWVLWEGGAAGAATLVPIAVFDGQAKCENAIRDGVELFDKTNPGTGPLVSHSYANKLAITVTVKRGEVQQIRWLCLPASLDPRPRTSG